MRLFIAIDAPEQIRSHLKSLQQQLPGTLNLANQFHLTLKFLGEVAPERVETIKKRLETITFQPFTISLQKIGVFPNENHIRIVWVGLEPQEPIIALHQSIDNALTDLFEQDTRFHPHLTLARVKQIDDTFKEKLNNLDVNPLSFTVASFKLIESTLTPQGATYKTLAEYHNA